MLLKTTQEYTSKIQPNHILLPILEPIFTQNSILFITFKLSAQILNSKITKVYQDATANALINPTFT